MSRVLQACLSFLGHGHAGMPRGAVKTASYALMHLLVAMTVAFALTRNWHAALAIGLVEPLVQTFAYSLHERVWARTSCEGGSRPEESTLRFAGRGPYHAATPTPQGEPR